MKINLKASLIFFVVFLVGLLLLLTYRNRKNIAQFPAQVALFSQQQIPPLPQDPDIQVYFNRNQSSGANYADPYRQIEREGDNLEQIIINAIASAKSSVDMAVQELNLPEIAQALVESKEKGVEVRVILENAYNKSWKKLSQAEIKKLDTREKRKYREFIILVDLNNDGEVSLEERNQRDALTILKNAGIPVIDDTADGSKGSGLMHHKFVIIDGKKVLTGSANFTLSGIHGDFDSLVSRGNANHLVQITSTQLANLFTEEFKLLWGDGVGGENDSKFGIDKPYRKPKKITVGDNTILVQFSPISAKEPWEKSSNGLIAKNLQKATESVDLALFVFSEQKLVNPLEKLSQQGVEIRTLIDPSFAFRYYSEGLDMLGVALRNKCQYEAGNNVWQNPITSVGVPQLPSGDKLHHKFAVIDNQIVITGSQNWSAAANNRNDETVLVIDNPTVADHFTKEMNRLYGNATLGLPDKIAKKIQEQENQCN